MARRRRAPVALRLPREPAAAEDRRRARACRSGSAGGGSRPTRRCPPTRRAACWSTPRTASARRPRSAAAAGDPAAIEGWERLYATCAGAARALWPTMTEPLRPAAELRALVGDDAAWAALVERPIGELIEDCLGDDALRGIALTDALIGTFAGAHDADLRQNRCFLYHVIGNGSGHWDVPMGGMGAVTAELEAAARAAGAELRCGAEVTAIDAGPAGVAVRFVDAGGGGEQVGGGRPRAGQRRPRGARSPARSRAVGRDARGRAAEGQPAARAAAAAARPRRRPGRRLRRHLPRQRGLRAARARPRAGRGGRAARRRAVRDLLPLAHRSEHPRARAAGRRRADADVLRAAPARRGCSRPTTTGCASARSRPPSPRWTACSPSRCSTACGATPRVARASRRAPRSTSRPSSGCPGGNIFHRDLSWPFAESEAEVGTWGVETDDPRVLVCGAGARRGGGVSGVPGRNAAMAVLGGR